MIRALPTPILPRLGQLVRLLGSPVEGERAAALCAMSRTLTRAGVDFHDLAAVVERPGVAAAEPARPAARKARKPAPRPRPAEPAPRRPPPPGVTVLTDEQRAMLLTDLAAVVMDRTGRTTPWDVEFAQSMMDTLGRRKLNPTERQAAAIARVLAKLQGARS